MKRNTLENMIPSIETQTLYSTKGIQQRNRKTKTSITLKQQHVDPSKEDWDFNIKL